MEHSAPTRDTLIKKLEALIAGSAVRSDVAAWAMVFVLDVKCLHATDETIANVLMWLGSADLPSTDRDYLYSEVDFEEWKSYLINN